MLFVNSPNDSVENFHVCKGYEDNNLFAICDCCKEEIYIGDEYYEIEDRQYCENCIADFCKQTI